MQPLNTQRDFVNSYYYVKLVTNQVSDVKDKGRVTGRVKLRAIKCSPFRVLVVRGHGRFSSCAVNGFRPGWNYELNEALGAI